VDTVIQEDQMRFAGPKSLKIEHDDLHKDLRAAIATGGRTGEAARMVADRLHPHFVREEELAMPLLGLLADLSRDGAPISADAAEKAIALTERLADELPGMLAEHREIVAALGSLIGAAQEENHQEIVRFAEKLKLHAQTEEEVLYPAALLVGQYLKLRPDL
jgi:hypothetical protein